jgi:hypothetical protein
MRPPLSGYLKCRHPEREIELAADSGFKTQGKRSPTDCIKPLSEDF